MIQSLFCLGLGPVLRIQDQFGVFQMTEIDFKAIEDFRCDDITAFVLENSSSTCFDLD